MRSTGDQRLPRFPGPQPRVAESRLLGQSDSSALSRGVSRGVGRFGSSSSLRSRRRSLRPKLQQAAERSRLEGLRSVESRSHDRLPAACMTDRISVLLDRPFSSDSSSSVRRATERHREALLAESDRCAPGESAAPRGRRGIVDLMHLIHSVGGTGAKEWRRTGRVAASRALAGTGGSNEGVL